MEGKTLKRIGTFKVTPELLGKGSFSEVYLALDQTDTKVAVKVVPISNLSNELIESFEREVNLLRKCKHNNIVNLIDVKKTRNNLYIFLDYCQEGTLADLIEKRTKMEEGEAMALFAQIVKGMQVLTVNKVIHRDLKPTNILLKNGVIKIADFGLAKKFMNTELLQTFAGSPLQMAPQILRGESYSEKVDVYSAGTILYEMLFGKAPFDFVGRDFQILLKAKDRGIKQSKINKISPKVRQLLRDMLQPNPEKRISMGGVLDFMEEYNQQLKQIKLNVYKQLSLQGMTSLGVMGSIIGSLNASLSNLPTPTSMDLRIYGQLYRKLTAFNN